MTDGSIREQLRATVLGEQQAGLKLAIKGRLIALWLGLSRSGAVVQQYLLFLSLFALVGVVHYGLIGTRWDRR